MSDTRVKNDGYWRVQLSKKPHVTARRMTLGAIEQ